MSSSASSYSPKIASKSTFAPTSPTSSSTLVRRSSATSTNGGSGSSSPTSQIKSGLKKLSISSDEPTSPYKTSAGSSSPLNRSRVNSLGRPSPTSSPTLGSQTSSTLASPTNARRINTSSNMSSNMSTPARPITKAPVQSPTAAGMKRPTTGSSLNTLSSIGPSALTAVSQTSVATNPYSSTLSASPSNRSASGAPSSPIASASPNARRYKSTPTSSPTAASQPPPASPIHSISQSGAAAMGGMKRMTYETPSSSSSSSSTVGASSTGSTASVGQTSYRAQHAPVNTHAHPPVGHVADHVVPVFSPVYSRTASQEQLRQEDEKNKAAAKARQEEEERYRQQVAVQAYMQQQQLEANARAAAAQQAQQNNQVQLEDEFDPFLFIKNLPPLSPAMRNRRSPLPKKSLKAPPITLALDLDETLVHCSVQPIEKAELTFKVTFSGQDYEVYARTRPHMKEFLETVSQWFEVIIFTASQKVYADKLLNILDPHGQYIKYRVFRDSCVCVEGNYLKDLHILGRDLHTVAIVDNSVQAFGFQLDHGIPIESWFDDENDRELLNLIPFLRQLKDQKDVRPLIRDTFRLSEFVASL